MNYQQHGDGVYRLNLLPQGAKDWALIGFVSVKNLDQAGAPDCDMAEWALSIKAMEELGLRAELPLPKESSVQLVFHSLMSLELGFAERVSEVYRGESGQPLAPEEFNRFRVVSFRKAI